MKVLVIRLLTVGLFTLWSTASMATHVRAAEITIERACNSLTVTMRLKVYLNTGSPSQFGAGESYIRWGDGSPDADIPTTPSTPRPDLGVNIGVAEFVATHTYPSAGVFTITYVEGDRASNVLNIPGSADIDFATFTTINLSDEIGCNTYPKLGIPPVDRACIGRAFTHNAGANDAEGDSLSYELLTPLGDNGLAPVPTYYWPNDSRFYTDFATGNEAGTGPPVFDIDPENGIITWDAPGVIGQFNIAFKITEWRKDPVTDEFVMLSITVRDMQIIVVDCQNERPDLIIPANVCVMAGQSISETIIGLDADFDPVKIEPSSEIFTVPNPATFAPSPPTFSSSNPNAQQTFQWNTDCSNVRDQPYQVIYKISDNPPPPQTTLVTFKAWSIKVIAPPPTWVNADVDLVKRHGMLSWNNTSCSTADRIQIWRKVGGYNFVAPPCFTGLPAYLGYTLVAEVDPTVTSFRDTARGKGLAAGATYCYRLVAVYDDPIAKSVVSSEICVGPIKADAPVLTHVTVEETGVSDGSIRVSWRNPFDMDRDQFPEPYYYEVYRGEGFESDDDAELTKVSALLSDTTFLDTGIDTDGKPYHYKVVVYSRTKFDPTIIPVDTSSMASSVRLEIDPGDAQLSLAWDAMVPWSNFADGYPMHLIYRGEDENDLILIDSVDVTLNGLQYVDTGTFGNLGIDPTQKYCYRVMTRGTYGNPKIALQKNYSQIMCVYPDNDLPTCTPEVTIDIYDCEAYLEEETCGPSEFINTIYWSTTVQSGCRSDIRSYNVYVAENDINGEYTLLATNVRDTFFIENNLSSLARCYKVAAVVPAADGTDQESELSDPVCNDNCPYYELPNVFTPGNADGAGCNDYFRPYYAEGGNPNCPLVHITRCPRFVHSVRLTIYNRWGKEVYTYNSMEPDHSIYIDWDGRDSDGTELESGIYYYVADVRFDAVDPAKKTSTIKGWLSLIR